MASNSKATRCGVWGASGSGKSYWMKHHAKKMKRVIVLDPQREYREIGFKPVRTTATLQAAVRSNPSGFKIAFEPSTDQSRVLNWLSLYCFKLQKPFHDGIGRFPQMNLIIDEMAQSFPLHKSNLAPEFTKLCSYGRHYGVNIYGVSQMPAQVDTAFRANCLQNVVFRQKSEANRKTAAGMVDVTPADIQSLAQYQFYHDDDTGPAKLGKLP